ncbi:MAG: hypothetical protein ACI4MT_05420 [Christensenellales bacterium]
MNQMLIALLSSMLSSKGDGMDFSKLLGAMSNNNENGDKMSMLINLLPQIMSAAKPMRKEDKYLKEAETMYGTTDTRRENFNQNTQNANAHNSDRCGSQSQYENCKNDSLNGNGGRGESVNTSFEEIKGFSTNEVNSALYALMNCNRS